MWGHRHWGGMRRGWLRPWVISIVGRSPKNGAEIIDEIEKMSWGGWRPSPGSIYPLLDQMTVEGALKKREDGRYELTDKGKDEGSFPFGFPFGQRPPLLNRWSARCGITSPTSKTWQGPVRRRWTRTKTG